MPKSYRLFIPPIRLAEKTPRDWTKREADAYMRWVIESVEERVAALLSYLGEQCGDDAEDLLLRVGNKVEVLLHDDQFATEGDTGFQLTNQGYALAADVGLLVAKLLLRDTGSALKWSVVRKPKSDMSYNLPVLIGFGERDYLEPVGVSVAYSHAILRGDRSSDVWAKLYSLCKSDVPN